MSFQLEWTIEGDTQLSRVLIGMESSLKDYTYPFRQSADFLKGVFSRDVFQTQGAVIGERWKPLSPYTVAQKARRGYPSTPLIGSGRMQHSFEAVVSSTQAMVYNTAAYFAYHQSKLPRSKIPRRVMMALADAQKEQVIRYFQEHIQTSMHKP